MEIDYRILYLNTKTKIMICFVLESNKLSIADIVKKIKNDYNIDTNRETIFRSLESLRENGIVNREYFSKEKKISIF